METQTLTNLTPTLQTLAAAVLVVAAYAFLQKIQHHLQIRRLPAFHNAISSEAHRKQYIKSAKSLYQEGYEKVKYILQAAALSSPLTDELQV